MYHLSQQIKQWQKIQLNKDETLFRVSVVKNTKTNDGNGNGFAIVISMSHIIGDGATYYSLGNKWVLFIIFILFYVY